MVLPASKVVKIVAELLAKSALKLETFIEQQAAEIERLTRELRQPKPEAVAIAAAKEGSKNAG